MEELLKNVPKLGVYIPPTKEPVDDKYANLSPEDDIFVQEVEE